MGIMRGPISMNINDEIGLLISGFDITPVIMMPYNMGVVKEYRHMGIETCFIHDTYCARLKNGYLAL